MTGNNTSDQLWAVFALPPGRFIWERRSGRQSNSAILRRFIKDDEYLRNLPPENIVIMKGDPDRHTGEMRIPAEILLSLAAKGRVIVRGAAGRNNGHRFAKGAGKSST